MANTDMQNEMNALKEDVAQLRADMGGLVSALKEQGQAKAAGARDKAQEEVDKALEQLMGAYSSAKGTGAAAAHRVEHQVEEHPLTSIMMALGVGVLVGAILGKK